MKSAHFFLYTHFEYSKWVTILLLMELLLLVDTDPGYYPRNPPIIEQKEEKWDDLGEPNLKEEDWKPWKRFDKRRIIAVSRCPPGYYYYNGNCYKRAGEVICFSLL